MPIIDFMNYFRRDTACPFYIDEHPNALLDPYVESGEISQSLSLSEDQLTKTLITRYKSLDVFNQVVNLNTIPIRFRVFEHNRTLAVPRKSFQETYKLLGIDQPFKLTSIYNFKPQCPYRTIFFNMLRHEQLTRSSRIDPRLNESTVVIYEHFKNADEFNGVRFGDGYWTPQLCAVGATRQLVYELI